MPVGLRHLRISLWVLLACGAGPASAEQSLAELVPADVGVYVEGRGLADLLRPLTEPEVWLGISELAGQPVRPEEVGIWRQQVRQTLGIEPAEAVDVFFSRQFAFVAHGPARLRGAVLLSRPALDVRTVLERLGAQPLPTAGKTSVYRLPGLLGLALPDGAVLLGDPEPATGMFRRVLEYADAQRRLPSLAEDAVFRQLVAKVPAEHDGLLFVRLRAAESGLPGPWRSAANLLVALHRQQRLLHFCLVSDAPASTEDKPGVGRLCNRLPARTLVAWGLYLDYPRLLARAERLPERNVFRVALRLHDWTSTVQRLTTALDSAGCLAVGVVESPSGDTPPVPAIAFLVSTRQPEVVAAEFERAVRTTVSTYNLLSLRVGSDRLLLPPQQLSIAGLDVGLVDLRPLLGGLDLPRGLDQLQFCWVVDSDALIVASHVQWLEQVLRARQGEVPTLAGVLQLCPAPPVDDSSAIVAVQTGPIADVAGLWLDYLGRVAPQVLEERWWRMHQPGGGRVQLGIMVAELAEEQRLRVGAVLPRSPADGVLLPADEIVGYGRRRFTTSQPMSEMRQALEERPDARWIDLLVERGGTTIVVRVPLPFVDPIAWLRRAVTLGRIAQRLVYCEAAGADGPRGGLTIELRSSGQPLFDFGCAPSSFPASQPTPGPATQTAPAHSLPGQPACPPCD